MGDINRLWKSCLKKTNNNKKEASKLFSQALEKAKASAELVMLNGKPVLPKGIAGVTKYGIVYDLHNLPEPS